MGSEVTGAAVVDTASGVLSLPQAANEKTRARDIIKAINLLIINKPLSDRCYVVFESVQNIIF